MTATLGVIFAWNAGLATAAPAAPSYLGVEKRIDSIRAEWSKPGAASQPNAAGWNALFDALTDQLSAYAKAEDDAERLTALGKIYEISTSLGTVAWAPAATLREEIRQWLRPRVRLAWARRRLSDTVQTLPATTDPGVIANRKRWVEFVQDGLGSALRDYEAAASVTQRQAALHRVHEALASLAQQNKAQSRQWTPSWELQEAVNDLFNQRNLDIAADLPTVSPVLNTNLVETGPVYRKGYVSQVTAGPKTGFGLLPSDDGITFYNSQSFVSVTPVWDFQNQIAQDQKGRKAAELYTFGATTTDWSSLTITTTLRPSGLEITPSYGHNINAQITSVPNQGGGLKRAIAGLIGMNQQKITDKVYEGAMPKFQEQIPVEAAEEGGERVAAEQATRNADLKSKFLVGNDTAKIRDFLITHLWLRSRPEAVFVSGLFQWENVPGQFGADAPQPKQFADTIDPGVTANIHLGSLLTSAGAGLWLRDQVQSVQNLMIVTKAVPPGTPPGQAVTVTKNVDFPTYLKAVEEAKKAKNPNVSALRVIRPSKPPEFSTDARGYLVALVHDFQVEVPIPDGQGQGLAGVPAKVFLIKIPLAEVVLSYKTVDATPGALKLHAQVEEFNPGTNAEVLAINDDEKKATALNRFSGAIIVSAVGAKLRSQGGDIDFSKFDVPGVKLKSISPLDPSGWVRANLERTMTPPQMTPNSTAAGPATASTATTPAQPAANAPLSTAAPATAAPAVAGGQ
jgi:hypothetical protein